MGGEFGGVSRELGTEADGFGEVGGEFGGVFKEFGTEAPGFGSVGGGFYPLSVIRYERNAKIIAKMTSLQGTRLHSEAC